MKEYMQWNHKALFQGRKKKSWAGTDSRSSLNKTLATRSILSQSNFLNSRHIFLHILVLHFCHFHKHLKTGLNKTFPLFHIVLTMDLLAEVGEKKKNGVLPPYCGSNMAGRISDWICKTNIAESSVGLQFWKHRSSMQQAVPLCCFV